MKLKLNEIISAPGTVPFDYSMDLSDLEINFVFPFRLPCRVTGNVKNTAGLIELRAAFEGETEFLCDRCAEPSKRPLNFDIEAVLVESLENPEDIENADVVVLENAEADIDRIVRDAVILECDMQFVCKDDCKGICQKCGKNLNDGDCGCEADIDPRLEALRALLDK